MHQLFAQSIDNNSHKREKSFNKLKTSMGMQKLIQPQLGETIKEESALNQFVDSNYYMSRRSTTPLNKGP